MNMLGGTRFIGGLVRTPHDLRFRAARPMKAASKIIPGAWDNRQILTPVQDQGANPRCVAEAMSLLIRSIAWREFHEIRDYPAKPLYDKCKDIDGNHEPGTSFTSAFQAAIELGYIPVESKAYGLFNVADVHMATHEFGACLVGLDVTEAWNTVGSDGWIHEDGGAVLGGHAILHHGWDTAGVDFEAMRNSWGEWGAKGNGRMRVADFLRRFLDGMAVEIPTVTGKGW